MIVNDQKKVSDEKDSIENKVDEKESIGKEEMKETKEKKQTKKEEKKKTETTSKDKKTENKKQSDKDYMMDLLDEHFSKFDEGKIVEGTVVSVDERNVLVDIGFKSESPISVKEFSSDNIPKIDSKIKVYIDSVEDGSGRLKLSKKKADFYLNIDKLTKEMEAGNHVVGTYRRRVKGGMIINTHGIEAFLPGSQISTKPIPNLDQFIGNESEFQILNIDKDRRNVIVSRRKVLLEEQKSRLDELKKQIEEDAELDGEVRNITEYGAFIDLGGIDGLLHITDMSWGHIKHPSDMLNIGDKVKVKVLNYNEEEQKVSLGLKQLVPHPWKNIKEKYPEGSIISGKVVNLTNYGAFVELEPGVEGLVHISEMSWTKKIKHPKQTLNVGDSIKAIVLSTSKEDKRISLGIKQMEANPWITIENRYPVDTVVEGEVKTLTPFGVFVEIENEIEGLVHISDISWTKRIYHPKEVLQKGQKVKVKVLSIDKTLHRIALGIKQLEKDPWENLDEKLPINTEITAKIVKIISKGVLVDVEVDDYEVEGFVPLSHLAIPGLKRAGMAFDKNEELPLKIIELDLENRRLILSVKAYFFAKSEKEFEEFVSEHQKKLQEKSTRRKKVKEIISEEVPKTDKQKKKEKETDGKKDGSEKEEAQKTSEEVKTEESKEDSGKDEKNKKIEAKEEQSDKDEQETESVKEEAAKETEKEPKDKAKEEKKEESAEKKEESKADDKGDAPKDEK